MNLKHLITFSLALALALSACGRGRSEEETPTPAPTAVAETAAEAPAPAATDTPSPAESAPAEEVPAADATGTLMSSDFVTPDEVVSTYRSRGEFTVLITYPDGTSKQEGARFETAFVRTDGSFGSDDYFRTTFIGEDADELAMTVYNVGEHTAMYYGDQWITAAREGSGMDQGVLGEFSEFLQPEAAGLEGMQTAGRETVNGIDTEHLFTDSPSLFPQMWDMDMDEDGDVQAVRYDIWRAVNEGFVVKWELSAQVTNVPETDDVGSEVNTNQSITWRWEIFDVDSNIQIEWPADAPLPGTFQVPGFGPNEFPLPPETELTSGFMGFYEFTSQQSLDAVNQFYEQTLPGMGWASEGTMGFYTWTKEDVSLTMMIAPDEASGTTQITVIPSN